MDASEMKVSYIFARFFFSLVYFDAREPGEKVNYLPQSNLAAMLPYDSSSKELYSVLFCTPFLMQFIADKRV